MRFVIRRNKAGKYWWRAVSDGNNKILAASELMESKRACEEGISIVKREAEKAPVNDKTDESMERTSV
jgi:uncharacterized protein YegP (UPF0339 family)